MIKIILKKLFSVECLFDFVLLLRPPFIRFKLSEMNKYN